MFNIMIPASELIINADGSVFHLHLRPEQLADKIVMCGDPGRVDMIASFFDTKECEVSSREFHTITGTYKGKRITALSHGIGPDNIDIVVTELDALKNVDFAKWQDESEWIKANPALGYGVQLENLRTKYTQTIGNAENEMSFKTKHLNIWCNSSKAWISDEIWTQAPSLKELGILEFSTIQRDLEWYGGLDLSSTSDITAYTLIAKMDEHFIIKPFFWLPSDNAKRRARNDRVPYIDWINKGLITATEGNVVDYAYLKSDIERINSEFNIKATAYDRWNSAGIITELTNEGLGNLTPFGQGYGSMSQPTKEIYALAMKKLLVHDNNPVLRWMISNVEILTDPAGNIKLAKNKSREKIDGVVALVMAYGVYSMLGVRETSSPSVRILEF